MRLICFYFCFFLLGPFVADATLSPLNEVPLTTTQAKPSIWKFRNKKNPREGGTAFAVGPNLVVTTWHSLVVSKIQGDPVDNMILSQDGNSSKIQINRIVAVSALYDLALIETKQSMESYFHLEDQAPLDDKNIFIPAYLPKGFINIQNTDPAFHKDSYSLEFPINVHLSNGASGSPALNKEGQIIGVSVAGFLHSIMITPFIFLKAFTEGKVGFVCNKFLSFEVCVEEDIKYLKRLAEQGDAFAQYQLARIYLEVAKTSEDKSQAVLWMKFSAEQDYIPAQVDLGSYYHQGIGVKRDFKKAFY